MRQGLNFELYRSGQLTSNEMALAGYIYTYSKFCCPPTMKVMADRLHWSVRKLRYVIKSLVEKGVIRRTYMAYKKLKLVLVSVQDQAALLGVGMLTKRIGNILNLRKKSSHRQKWIKPHRQKQIEPIENKTLIRIKDSENDFFTKTNKSAWEQTQELLKARALDLNPAI